MTDKSDSFKSIMSFKCPKCHDSDMFCNKSLYRYKDFFKMPDNCPKCGQDFQMEPGFYFGAMYVSYGLTIAINVATFVALFVFDIYSITSFLISAFFILLITLPYVFKISRVIWIAMMVSYDPNAIKDYAAQHPGK